MRPMPSGTVYGKADTHDGGTTCLEWNSRHTGAWIRSGGRQVHQVEPPLDPLKTHVHSVDPGVQIGERYARVTGVGFQSGHAPL
jgi:hypothetical protein